MEIENLKVLSDDILDELLTVWEHAVRSSHHFLKEGDIEYFKPLVRDCYLPAVDVFVVRDSDGVIAGFMGLSDDMLEMLFVRPEEQRNGCGRALVDYAVNRLGIYNVDVNEDNLMACRFYEKMGYKVIGRDECDPTGKPYPILHMRHASALN